MSRVLQIFQIYQILDAQNYVPKIKSFFSIFILAFCIFSCGDRGTNPAPTTTTSNSLENGQGNVDFIYVAGSDSVLYYRKLVSGNNPFPTVAPGSTIPIPNKSGTTMKILTQPPSNTSYLKCYFQGKLISDPDANLIDPFANDQLSGYQKERLLIEDLESASKLSVVVYNGSQHFKLPTTCDAGVTVADYNTGGNQNFFYNIYYLELNGSKTLLESANISLRYETAP